jgi:diguanylate cyclase (GGDEF)-like protein
MRILIVEDDEIVAHALTEILANQNYAVEVAAEGLVGWEMIQTYDYDLILLDVMLPKLDGISLCRRLRSQGYQMPVLLLTGKHSGHDKAIGLDAGADDYVVKPFDEEELVARVRALLRRSGSVALPVLEWDGLRLDPTSCQVSYNGKLLSLTPKEYALLELFLRNNRRVFSCGMILEHLWAYDETPGEEAVRTHIKGLRQKLKAAGMPADVIETVYGIGYRLRSLAEISARNGQSTQAHTAVTDAHPSREQTLRLVAKTWHRFKGRVSEQVSVLERATTALWGRSLDPELRQQARQEAHSLAGALGTFGFPEGSRLARQIEGLIQTGGTGSEETAQLQQWVTALRQEIERPLEEQTPAVNATTGFTGSAVKAPTPESIDEQQQDYPLLLLVDRDRPFVEAMVQGVRGHELRVAIASSLSSARRQIQQDHPDVVLLDLEIAPDPQAALSLMTELQRHTPPIPVLVVSSQGSIDDRLAIARYGKHTFLEKPLPPEQILDAAQRVLQRSDTATCRILVVDDDTRTLALMRSLLRPWGLQVTTLSDPRRFWETLETCDPDLLILDVEMPHRDGIELCRVVRNDSRWASLPILFLTAHTEPDVLNQVFAAGADDFVGKPVIGPELVTRIINRLERIRLLRQRAEIDPLTRVSNRQKSTQQLETYLHRARHNHQSVCFALLDVDNLKQINDRYGHSMGDTILRHLGYLLRQQFDREDVVARWGGEEFVVGMYGVSSATAVQRLQQVLTALEQQMFLVQGPDEGENAGDGVTLTHVTCSAGVVLYPGDGEDVRSLYLAADAALLRAKQRGKGQIECR